MAHDNTLNVFRYSVAYLYELLCIGSAYLSSGDNVGMLILAKGLAS